MIHRERLQIPQYVYPADAWRLVEARFYPQNLAQTESFFATSNGYLGLRGSPEEGAPCHDAGTFVNGFYESWPIVYGEEAHGFARTGQTIVGVTDAKLIKLYVDDEPFYLPTADLIEFERALDMRAGTLDRNVLWETPAGKRVRIRSQRLVSYEHRHLAAIAYEVTLENDAAPLAISSEVVYAHDTHWSEDDPRVARAFSDRVMLPAEHHARELRMLLGHVTRRSDMRIVCGVDHVIESECPYTIEAACSEDAGKIVVSADACPGQPLRIVKYITYHTSRRAPVGELCGRAERTLDRARSAGFGPLLESQRERAERFWSLSDVQFSGDTRYRDGSPVSMAQVQQAVRFNLFHIFQASVRAEGAGIPAKGLTGRGYEGHYFWDTEIYVMPFLIYTAPRIARNLLKFRHGFLDKARERAREVNQRGALFPWRTINGEEASAYYAAGTAQYHIDADIVYALRKYVLASGDEGFLHAEGVEILVETARLWRDLGFFSERGGGRFEIVGVTGPDEYNTVVNNNCFTNLMARENLWFAAETVEKLRKEEPDRFAELVHRTGLDPAEIQEWRSAADRMYVPYDEERGIHLQDDEFWNRKPWDFDGIPRDQYPLLLHFHPLVIYRHQVIKQADVILANFLLGDEFSDEEKRRNFEHYDPLTTGDSSLSSCIQGIVAAEIGDMDKAVDYIRYAALMDLADVAGNVRDGLHIASMGGTWMSIVNGFAGFRDHDGSFSFRPRLPPGFARLRFPLRIHDQVLDVDMAGDSVTYSLRGGEGLVIQHEGEEVRVTAEGPVKLACACHAPPTAAG